MEAIPRDFPPWKMIYSWNTRLKNSGKWQEIHGFLVKKVRKVMEKKEAPSIGQSISKSN